MSVHGTFRRFPPRRGPHGWSPASLLTFGRRAGRRLLPIENAPLAAGALLDLSPRQHIAHGFGVPPTAAGRRDPTGVQSRSDLVQ
jgi:hypothetical protein